MGQRTQGKAQVAGPSDILWSGVLVFYEAQNTAKRYLSKGDYLLAKEIIALLQNVSVSADFPVNDLLKKLSTLGPVGL